MLMWRRNIVFGFWQASLVPHSDSGPSFSVEIRLCKIGGFFWNVIHQAEGDFLDEFFSAGIFYSL